MTVQRKGKRSLRSRASWILLFILLLIFLVIGVRTSGGWLVAPLVRLVTDVGGAMEDVMGVPFQGVRSIYRRYIDLRHVAEENLRLRLEVESLKAELARFREAKIENIRLKKLLRLEEERHISPLVAHVVGADVTPWLDSIVIDKGRRAGVTEGAILLAGAGVVGQVVESGLFYSRAMLVSDRNSAVAVLVQRSRARGILRGEGRGLCRLDYVAAEADVKVGDVVITSGLDGVFPKGLLIGTVVAVEKSDSGSSLFKRVEVRPDTDLTRLEEVLVEPPGIGAEEKRP